MSEHPDLRRPALAADTAPAGLASTLLRLSHDLLALTDGSGAIAWANAGFFETTGLPASGGAALHSLLPAGQAGQASHDAVQRALRGGALHDVELAWQTPAGAPLWVRVRTVPSPAGIVWVLQDITQAVAASHRADRRAQSLGDTAEELALALDLGNVAVWRHDLQTQLMHYSDRAWQVLDMQPRTQGIPLDEVRSLVHPDDVPRVVASAQQTLATGQPTDVEARYRRRDGTWRHIMTRRALVRGKAGEPLAFLGVGLDVTEQVERTRRASELASRLAAAANAAHVGIWTTSAAAAEPEWNEKMFELFDVDKTRAAPALRPWVETCVHPDDRERVLHEALAYLRNGSSPLEFELKTIRRDGSSRWIVLRADLDRSSPGQRRLIGVALDVTEHREALAALRSADERAALAARSAGIGTWEADMASGAERWDEQMFVLRELPVRDKPLTRDERLAMLHPDDAERVLDAEGSAVGPDDSSQYEFRIRLPSGAWRWLASRSIPVRDDQGAPVRRVGVNWDITESKNAQVALQEKAIAERESRAKSQFLSRMSHELRTPMNAVLGFTQVLLRDAGRALSDEQKKQLAHILTAGEHLLSLINDALELSTLESGNVKLEPQAIDLCAIVDQAMPLVESLAQQRQVRLERLEQHQPGAPPVLAWADPTRVRQVLLNLLSNAIKYNRSQGAVTISVNVRGGMPQVRVTDTGRGMSPEQLAHLFEPFNRLGIDSEGIEGTGIGLVIVKALVEGMGGSLRVTSQAGQGTVVELSLPAPAPGTGDAALPFEDPAKHGRTATRRCQGCILYIEDNPVNVLLVQELVGTLPGLTLVAETTGHAGVRRAASLMPDLVLVDMQLPDFDGFEVFRRLRGQPETASIPCIALSANAMPDDIARALGAGFEHYWTKPIDLDAFIAALERRFALAPT